MGSFLGSIFGTADPVLSKIVNQTGAAAGQEQGVGTGDVNAASTFYRDILGGGQAKIAQALSPEISAAQAGGEQAKLTGAEFGTRSGGTTAANQNIDAATRGNLINLIGGLQSGAAAGAGSLGTSQEQLALQNLEQQRATEQQQIENERSGLLGQAFQGALDVGLGAATAGLGKIPGLSSVI